VGLLHSPPMEHVDFVPEAWAVIPFSILLIVLAAAPLVWARWWESNLHKFAVASALGAPVIALYVWHAPTIALHAAMEYASFVILIGSLFFVAGGVLLEGDLEATPLTNCAFLGLGALLASAIGTTGASMLLIRPLLSTNQERRYLTHTIV